MVWSFFAAVSFAAILSSEIKVDKICLAGTVAYDRLKSLLTSTLLLGDIKKLSSDAQTSCLEGFHATLNHWHPKMRGLSNTPT